MLRRPHGIGRLARNTPRSAKPPTLDLSGQVPSRPFTPVTPRFISSPTHHLSRKPKGITPRMEDDLEERARAQGDRAKKKGRGGGGGQGGMGREVQVSKALSRLLRHQAEGAGIKLDEAGFAELDKVVSLIPITPPPLLSGVLNLLGVRNLSPGLLIFSVEGRNESGHHLHG